MTRSDYLSNSAKLLLVSSLLLLVANVLSIFGEPGSSLDEIGSKLSTVSFYVVFFFSFIAFNGEGISHKRSRSFRRKRVTTFLKVAVLFAFLYRFVKVYVIKLVRIFLLLNSDSGLEDALNIFLALLNTAASYGYVLTVASLWYLYRDSQLKSLFLIESASFLVGLCYNLYKVFYYAINNYGLESLGRMFSDVFSNQDVYHGLCLAQYGLNVVMFVAVAMSYGKKAATERESYEKAQKKLTPALSIYNTDCVGIDTLDDDFA